MRRLLSVLICVLATDPLFAQEICNNGLDDDADGLVDCYDSDCSGDDTCEDFFIVNGCQMDPPAAPAFSMMLDFSSANETTNHFSRMAVGDIDGDGVPEIITMNKYTQKLVILNGNDGSIQKSVTMTSSATPEWEIAIANIDPNHPTKPDCAEIFFLGTDSRIYVYDCDLNFLYRTNAMPGNNDPINFGLADFDGDGLTEIYCKDQIFDAHSGRRLVATTRTDADWGSATNGGPVAVDMTGTANLELVLGLAIYSVNIPVGRGTDAGSLTLLSSRPEYFIRNHYNATSVADFNQDGRLDVIASGSTGCHGKNTTIFFWDVFNNQLKTYSDHNSINGDGDYRRGWKNGTGRVNIADLDGDGNLNLSYVSGGFLYALKHDMTKLWKVAINEETSGYTGCTLFDFNGDGKSEIVYRDEQNLYIIDGTDGSIFNSQPCVSRTNREYPIVADVDADGSTEICVTCGFDDAAALANFNTTSYSQYSHVRVFKSAAEPWVPARRVWNQHGYFVVNINDDLTIPKQQTRHEKVFDPAADCRNNGQVRATRPLNKFLNQSPYLDTRGCPSYSAPNFEIVGTPSAIAPTCPDLNFQVSFTIRNAGDITVTDSLYVSFYDKNPTRNGATKLATKAYFIDLSKDETFTKTNQIINSGGADSLYIVLNDAGITSPLSQPNTDILECTYEGPLGIAIKPKPVQLTAEAVTQHENCAAPPTGSAKAYVLKSGVQNTTDYNFYWFNGAAAGPIASANFTGPVYTGLVDGDYQVYAIHKTAKCSSDTTQATITLAGGSGLPAITVTKVSDQTSCNPPNGSLQATVTGPGGNAGYTFSWENGSGPIGVTSALLSNQVAGTYTVVVSKNGCTGFADGTIGEQTIPVDVTATATHVTNCTDLTGGSVTATALLNGVPQPANEYTFSWYQYDTATNTRGSVIPSVPPGADGPTRSTLPAGFYEVVARRISTECESPSPYVIEIKDNTVVPTVTLFQLQEQKSCNPLAPNGKLRADVRIGGILQPAADFKYEWFEGQNTITPHTGGTEGTPGLGTEGQIAINLKGGGQAYTVRITTASNCVAITDDDVNEDVDIPVVTLTPTPNEICNPALATTSVGNYTGTVTATVSFDGANVTNFSGYTFEWYDGKVVKPATDYPLKLSSNVIDRLDSNYYTLRVTNTTFGCVSLPKTAQVINNTTLPNIVTTTSPSTNCTPGQAFADGIARVATIDGVNAPATNYKYSWSSSVAPATFNVDNLTNHADKHELIKVQGGNVGMTPYSYSVTVINTNTGCQNTKAVNVGDAKVLPVVTLAATDNTICSPATSFNGRITATITPATIVGTLANYSFTFGGGSVTGTPGAIPNHNQYTKLEGGPIPYTVIAKHDPTGCESSQVSLPVGNNQDLPDLTTTSTPSTNCDLNPLLANGTASVVTVDGAAPGPNYTFAWGASLAPAFTVDVTNNKANEKQLVNVQGGAGYTYPVLVTNTTNGCTRTANVNVADAKVLPVLSLTPAPNSICDPSKGFTGSVTAAITNMPVGSTATSYTFDWSTGTDGDGVLSSTGLDVGTYTVTALHKPTGCLSNVYSAQVTNSKVLPTITTSQTPAQYCSGATQFDGVARVTNVVPNGKAYDYKWFDGNAVGVVPNSQTLNTTATTNSYSNVQGGLNGPALFQYTVQVTILESGCSNFATVGVANNSQKPVATLKAPIDNTNCKPDKNGIAELNTLNYRGSLILDYTGFTFAWSAGGPGSTTGTTYSQLPAGTYTLTVTNTDDNCISDPVPVTIQDKLFTPPIIVDAIDQTSCNPSTPNGSLDAFVNETTIGGPAKTKTGYTFTWVNDVTPTPYGTTNPITLLKGEQTYTVTVKNNATECTNTRQEFLNETLVKPSAVVTASPVTSCATPNGQLSAVVTPAAGTYKYFWYTGSDALDENYVIHNSDSISGATYSNLVPRDYTLVVRNETTRCISQQVIKTVIASPVAAAPVPIALNITIPADCDAKGGTVDGGVQLTVNPNNFTSNAVTNRLSTTTPLGLSVNDKVVITKTGTLPVPLEANKVYFIQNISGNLIRLSLTAGGPAIDITANGVGSIGDFKTAGYTYEWYRGVPSPSNPGLGSINYFTNPPVYDSLPMSTASILNNITTGLYTIQVTNTTTGCKGYLPHTLPYQNSHAVLKINKTNSTECPYTTGNGSIEIQIEDPATAPPAADQTSYNLFLISNGIETPLPPASDPVNPFILANLLAPGSYTVKVQETYSGRTVGCSVMQDVIIGADALPPVVSLVGTNANTACIPAGTADGSIQINIAKDPADLVAGVTYNISMNPAATVYLPNQPVGNYSALNLAPNTYTYTVNSSNHCSTTKSFTVLDNPTKAQFTAADISITDAQYCDIMRERSAKVIVNQLQRVGGGNEVLADYLFEWKNAANTTVHLMQGSAVNIAGGDEFINQVPAAANGTVAAGTVVAGSYTVKATKNNNTGGTGGVGCVTPVFNITIGSNKIDPTIALTSTGDTACDPATFEGSILANVTTASGPGAGGTYGYVWAPTGAAGQPTAPLASYSGVNNNFTSINDGSYTLTATNDLTGCFASRATTVDKKTPPVFTLTASAFDLTNCASFDGRINTVQIFIDGVGGDETQFDYTWYKTDLLGVPVIDGTNDITYPSDIELTTATYGAIAVDQYFVKAIRKSGLGDGCESAPLRKEILDARKYPQVTLNSTANNTCDNPLLAPQWNGGISVAATTSGFGAGTRYDFNWTANPGTAGLSITPGANIASGVPVAPSVLSFANYSTASVPGDRIAPGSYTVEVFNRSNSCVTPATVVVQQQTVPVDVTLTTTSPLTHCTVPNGSVAATQVKVGGTVTALGEFAFEWTGAGGPYVTASVPNLSPGDYIVRATKNSIVTNRTAYGCVSPPATVTVLDQTKAPMITMGSTASTACLNSDFDGEIKLSMGTPGFGAGTQYDFTWTANPGDPGIQVSNGTVSSLAPVAPSVISMANYTTLSVPGDRIAPGSYTVHVVNQTNQCPSDATVIVQKNPAIIALTATKTNQTICAPADGTITVTGVTRNGVSEAVGNFNFHWYKTSVAAPEIVAPAVGNSQLTAADGILIDAGVYFVKAVRTNAAPSKGVGCESAPVRLDILDDSRDPDISFTRVRPDSSCNSGVSPMGMIAAKAIERDATVDNYTFNWTLNGGALNPLTTISGASPVSQLTNASIGTYSVIVTNTMTGCSFNQNVLLTQDQSRSLPSIVRVDPTNPTDCNDTGAARVTQIILGGTSTLTSPPDDIVTDFDYQWLKGSTDLGVDNPALSNQSPGTYFVKVVHVPTQCPSTFVEVVIDSADIVYPVVATSQTAPQVLCSTTTGSAVLFATADMGKPVNSGNTPAQYQFSWYTQLDTLGAALPLPLTAATLTNRMAGNYSVKVHDLASNCNSYSNFIIEDDSTEYKPNLVLSSDPLTLCVGLNGSLMAQGLHFTAPPDVTLAQAYPFSPYNYTVDVYTGTPADLSVPGDLANNVAAAPGSVSESFMLTGLADGIYTVRLNDMNTGCSTVGTVEVDLELDFKKPTITVLAALTNCYGLKPNGIETQPNGVAQASIGGTFVGYSFEWFEGTIPAGSPLYTGAQFDNLKGSPVSYVVRATNLATGCADSTVFNNVPINQVTIEKPAITIVSQVTSCDPNNPNGILTATVDGNTIDYVFDWYDGLQVDPAPTTPIDFTGIRYDSLAIGFYGVTATSKITGCVSPLTFEELELDQDFPDLNVQIHKATCGIDDGSVNLTVTSSVAIDTIQWYTEFGTVSGNEISGAEGNVLGQLVAGKYSVRVKTILGCESTKDLEITPEIRPFNGISHGTPGMNDYFHIDCIQNFTIEGGAKRDNIVRIYNRAGTLVYEAHGYDNTETYFDGQSNKGVSPMGTNLPDGTYFFIVDKNDGSRSIAGYLEIVK